MDCDTIWPNTLQCSGNGNCINVTCNCDPGWSGIGDFVSFEGKDCTVNENHMEIISVIILVMLVTIKFCPALFGIINGFRIFQQQQQQVKKEVSTDNHGIINSNTLTNIDGSDKFILSTAHHNLENKSSTRNTIQAPKKKHKKQERTQHQQKGAGCFHMLKEFFAKKTRACLDLLCIMDASFMAVVQISKLLFKQNVGHNMIPTIFYSMSALSFFTYSIVFQYNWIKGILMSDISLRSKSTQLLKKHLYNINVAGVFFLTGCISLFSLGFYQEDVDPVTFQWHVLAYNVFVCLGLLVLIAYSYYFGLKLNSLLKNSLKTRANKVTVGNVIKVTTTNIVSTGDKNLLVTATTSPKTGAAAAAMTKRAVLSNNVAVSKKTLIRKIKTFMGLTVVIGLSACITSITVCIAPWLWRRSMIFIGVQQTVGTIIIVPVATRLISYHQR